MAVVGDRVQVPSVKVGQTSREGVVTGVVGSLLRVRWSTGEESTFTPAPGSLMVVGRVRVSTARPKAPTAATPAKGKSAAKTSKAKSAPATAASKAKSAPAKANGAPARSAARAKSPSSAKATKTTKKRG
jgi:hypothetical protein